MKKLKILFSMICAIAIISSLCVPAFAYSDGDREVLYYNFNIGKIKKDAQTFYKSVRPS